MKNHIRRPRGEYEALYQRKLDERLTYAALSAESSVPIATLQYWFRRFTAEQSTVPPESPGESDAFVRIAVGDADDKAAIEIVLRDDVRLRVRRGFDEETVQRLVQLLGC